jgi:hypothetical protein
MHIFKYIWLTIKHKWFVFVAGRKLGVSYWRLFLHDVSKFSLKELPQYAQTFFGDGKNCTEFSYAWNHHQKCNKHHWEYWVMITGHTKGGYPDGSTLPMPVIYAKEMVADWIGASRTYEKKWPKSFEEWAWMKYNFDKIQIHESTRELCRNLLFVYFTGKNNER